MDKEITKVYETKSDFINDILTQMKSIGSYYMDPSMKDKIKLNKDLIKSDVDKWIWNQLSDEDKFEIVFNPGDYVSKYVNTKMSSYGFSDTYYGEWIRAFNKLIYRLQNDGDDVIYGPYSAIRVFMMRGIGDMRFHWGEEFMELQCDYRYDENTKEWEYDYDHEPMMLNGLIHLLCKGVDFFMLCDSMSNYSENKSYRHPLPDGMNWESIFNIYFMMVDQINDDLKGGKSNYSDHDERWRDSADKYYKNIMEYFDEDLYNILSKHFSGWDAYFRGENSADSYTSYAEELRINRDYDNYEFEFSIYPLIHHSIKFTRSDIKEGEDNEKMKMICDTIDLWKAYFYKKDKTVLTLKNILNYPGDEMNPTHVVIVKDGITIYDEEKGSFNELKEDILKSESEKFIDKDGIHILDLVVRGINKDYLENVEYKSNKYVNKITYVLSNEYAEVKS